ncbi:MAG: hypothetical protein WEB06_18950 [Actinomycetota bacterium]
MARRLTGLTVLVLGFVFTGGVPAVAGAARCGDIASLTAVSSLVSGPGPDGLSGYAFEVSMGTGVARCAGIVEYDLVILDGESMSTGLAQGSTGVDPRTRTVTFSWSPLQDDDPAFCIVTWSRSMRLEDWAPDAGCLAVTAGARPVTIADPLGDPTPISTAP